MAEHGLTPSGDWGGDIDVIHTSEGEWNPTDYAYHLTRRARGLPLWFSLAVYGVEAYREAIEVAARLARETADLQDTSTSLLGEIARFFRLPRRQGRGGAEGGDGGGK